MMMMIYDDDDDDDDDDDEYNSFQIIMKNISVSNNLMRHSGNGESFLQLRI